MSLFICESEHRLLAEVRTWCHFIVLCLLIFICKDKRRSKNVSSGNATVSTDDVEPCDHHLDCLPGQCTHKPISRKINYTEAWTEKSVFFFLVLWSCLCLSWIISGSCCDLRHHECKPHNRGLNNKCFDDCMCEEGGWVVRWVIRERVSSLNRIF